MLDASAVVELILNTERGRRARQRLADPTETLHAPHLLTVEVTQVLRRFVTARWITAAAAASAIVDLVGLDVERHDHEALVLRMWALRHNVTAYDAAYVALAEALDAPLLTTDGRLARAPGLHAVIELLD